MSIKINQAETIIDVDKFIEVNKATYLTLKDRNPAIAKPYLTRLNALKAELLKPGNEALADKYLKTK